jgi:hypothetical protein
MKIGAVQDVAADRIEKRFRQLWLPVIYQQADVVQLDFTPNAVGQIGFFILVFQILHALLHAAIVESDALSGFGLRLFPGHAFEVTTRSLTALPEESVMFVEAVENHACDIERNLGRQ